MSGTPDTIPAAQLNTLLAACREVARMKHPSVEHLLHGAVAVKFDGYPNTVDYSAREAMHFTKFYD